ncbi:MAG: hypothetical protein MK171_09160 [Pirellulales bacterium]|nr:hypothetical protein [Pirellulales bacterium]
MGTKFFLAVAGLVAFCSGGCAESPPSLAGTVTLDGRLLDRGALSLVPIAGGPTVGATIRDGQFRIDEIATGKYRAAVRGFAKTQIVSTTAELAAQSNTVQGGPPPDIAAGTIGSRVEVEIRRGHQQRDFPLRSPM